MKLCMDCGQAEAIEGKARCLDCQRAKYREYKAVRAAQLRGDAPKRGRGRPKKYTNALEERLDDGVQVLLIQTPSELLAVEVLSRAPLAHAAHIRSILARKGIGCEVGTEVNK